MASPKVTPRTHSSSPRPSPRDPKDPLKSSILQNSSHGWSPLRISKRDESPSPSPHAPSNHRKASISDDPGPPQVARRSSSSFSHLKTGSLVSKSPFKSDNPTTPGPIGAKYRPPPQSITGGYALSNGPRSTKIPTSLTRRASPSATTRRVSGGKKRVSSGDQVKRMLAAENAAMGSPSGINKLPLIVSPQTQHHPGFKRKQSRGFQGLSQAEYVSKSPFSSDYVRGRSASAESQQEQDYEVEANRSLEIRRGDSSLQNEREDEQDDDDNYEDIDYHNTRQAEETFTQKPTPPSTPTPRRPARPQAKSPTATPPAAPHQSPSPAVIALHSRVAQLAAEIAASPKLRSPSSSPRGSPRHSAQFSPKPSPRTSSAYHRMSGDRSSLFESSPVRPPSPTTLVIKDLPSPTLHRHSPSPSPSPSPPPIQPSYSHHASMIPTKSALKTKRRLRGPRSRSPSHSPERRVSQSSQRRISSGSLSRRGSNGSYRKLYRVGSGGGGRVVRLRNGSLRRERRKTVTFDERCDVVEFERDEAEFDDEDEEYYDEDSELLYDEDGNPIEMIDGDGEWVTSDDGEDAFFGGSPHNPRGDGLFDGHVEEEDKSMGQHEAEVIDGLVNEILEAEMKRMSFGFDGDSSREELASFSIDPGQLSGPPSATSSPFGVHKRSHSTIQEEEEDVSAHLAYAQGEDTEDELEDVRDAGLAGRGSANGLGAGSYSLPELAGSSPFIVNGAQLGSNSPVAPEAAPTRSPAGRRSSSTTIERPHSFPPPRRSDAGLSEVDTIQRMESASSLTRTDSGRSPRISKEDVKRRLMMQREGSGTDSREGSPSTFRPVSKALPTPPTHQRQQMSVDMNRQMQSHSPVLQSTKRDDTLDPPRPSMGRRSNTADGMVTHPLDPSIAASFGVGPADVNRSSVDIGDVRSALDRLMIGVESGFNDERTEPPPGAPYSRPPSMGGQPQNWNAANYALQQQHHRQQQANMIATSSSPAPQMSKVTTASPRESLTTTTDEDGPPTPPMNAHQPYLKEENDQAVVVNPDDYSSHYQAHHQHHHHLQPHHLHPDATTMRSVSPTAATSPTTLTRAKSGKEKLKEHEALILAKRREMRQRNGSESSREEGPRSRRRRSLSTGVADDAGSRRRRAATRLDLDLIDVEVEETDLPFTDSIERELSRMFEDGTGRKYRLRERNNIIYATSDEKVSHVGRVGDVDSGKAWRVVRRPSDMNEYSRQIREYRAQEKPGRASGKVFVRVLGVKGINVPIPSMQTAINCTLNNGIHCVATPDCKLAKDSRIDQEFELIEHGQLEFTLTIKVRKDPHIVAMMHALHAPPPPPRPGAPKPKQTPALPAPKPTTQKSSGGFFGSLFGGAPKKAKHKRAATQPEVILQPPSPPPPPTEPKVVEENIARYLRSDGTLGRAFISFKEIADRCDTRLFETSFSLIGQVVDEGSESTGKAIGEIVLQIFRLPPLPGVAPDALPQSLDECHSGLRHIAWHKVMYHEGILTQIGGDCRTWRRRHIRIIGANLVAFNDVTKKPTTTIELKKVVRLDDGVEPSDPTQPGRNANYGDDFRVQHSFSLIFPKGRDITFYADSEGEKTKWLEILRALIVRIPPNPLWAELVWQRQEDLAEAAAAQAAASAATSTA